MSVFNDVMSTRSSSGASWIPMIGKSPFATWQLDLSQDTNVPNIAVHLANEDVADILMVLTYSARTPAWPT
jgi:hypothetical protein